MKRFLMLPVLLCALILSACGPGSKLGDLIAAAGTTVTNPVDAVDIYRVRNVYAAALEGVASYREYCWSKPYSVLMADPAAKVVCKSRRPMVRAMQSAQVKAGSAILEAERFVRDNPTLNAATAISAAWRAVTNFQNAVPVAN